MTMQFQHDSLAAGRWFEFSLAEQLGNIGSEVHRAIRARDRKDEKRYDAAIVRTFELFYLTINDPRWRGAPLKELTRTRECLCDAVLGGEEYGSTLEDLDRYLYYFAYAARRDR